MKTLRNSKALPIFGALAVMLAAGLAAAPSAEAGCGGYGYSVRHYHAAPVHYVAKPVVHVKYVTPVVTPVYTPTYYAPTYYAPNFHYGW